MKLHLYFARRFFTTLFAIFGIFLLFMVLLDLVDQIRRFDHGEIGFRQALGLAVLNTPTALYSMLPLIVMLATLALYLALARSSELVVSRASGRSALRSLIAPVASAFLAGLVTVAVLNPIVAGMSKQYETLRANYSDRAASVLSLGKDGLWLRQGGEDGQMVIRAAQSNLDGTVLSDVTFIALDDMAGPQFRIDAQTAELRDGSWLLTNTKRWDLSASVSNPELTAVVSDRTDLPTELTRDRIRDSFGTPSSIPIWELPAFVEDLRKAGFSALRHEVWMHMELALPAFYVAMVMIAAGFTMRHTRFGKTGVMVMSALGVGLALFFLRSFAQVLGESGQIPVLMSAWAPPIIGILFSLGLVLHLEDG